MSDLYSLQVSNVEHKAFENNLKLKRSKIVIYIQQDMTK